MENTDNEVGLSDSTVISEIAEFDEQKNELNNRFDNNDIKLNEIKTEIKSEFNCKFDVL